MCGIFSADKICTTKCKRLAIADAGNPAGRRSNPDPFQKILGIAHLVPLGSLGRMRAMKRCNLAVLLEPHPGSAAFDWSGPACQQQTFDGANRCCRTPDR